MTIYIPKILLSTLIIATSFAVGAVEVFETKDQQGDVEFSDQPSAGAKEIEVNPNVVKVVSNNNGMALYFSRAAIPWPREHKLSSGETLPPSYNWFRHIGIYAYRVEFLHQFVKWAPAPLEQLEHLEQLRAMYYGVGIHVEKSVEAVPGGVDTQQDLDGVRASFAGESVS